jgi:hypothetical protein
MVVLSGDPKNAHLIQLDKAPENLHLFKADVLDYDTLTPAVKGCEGVFHLATPVPEDKIVDPEASVSSLARSSCLLSGTADHAIKFLQMTDTDDTLCIGITIGI